MARMTQPYDLKDRCIEFHHCNNVMNISHFVRDGLTRLLYTLQQSQLCYNLECQPQAINYTVSTLYVAAVLVDTNLMFGGVFLSQTNVSILIISLSFHAALNILT